MKVKVQVSYFKSHQDTSFFKKKLVIKRSRQIRLTNLFPMHSFSTP